jgi:hypothetical protein
MTAVEAGINVRVWVTDVWDTVELWLPPDCTVAELKRQALLRATGREPCPGEYQVKFRGALVLDESQTLADLGAKAGAPFIVLPARRRPVW